MHHVVFNYKLNNTTGNVDATAIPTSNADNTHVAAITTVVVSAAVAVAAASLVS